MTTAIIRNMSHVQNLHVLPNNCVIVSSNSSTPQSPTMMHHHHHHQNSYHTQHYAQTQQQTSTMHQSQQQHQLGKRPIAPAPAEHNRSTVISNMEQARNSAKKTKLAYAMYSATQPASVQRRNARERNRVKQVNNGFANLRQHIPTDVITELSHGGRGASKKLSKVDTLRIAVEYIRRLQDLLEDNDNDTASTSSSRISQNSNGSYYSSSPMQCNSIPPPPCSESSASPTPSFSSDSSSMGNTYAPIPGTYKYEIYDNYSPEDEELLDCIAWWEQQ